MCTVWQSQQEWLVPDFHLREVLFHELSPHGVCFMLSGVVTVEFEVQLTRLYPPFAPPCEIG